MTEQILILIVEDEFLLAEMAEEALVEGGYRVHRGSACEQAISELDSNKDFAGLNQLYHEHGVAQTLEQHADTVGLRAEYAAKIIRVDDRIQTKRAAHAKAVAPTADRFEVFRADEVQVTSTQFAGGDWRWRLADAANNTLVEGGGYGSKSACVGAVSLLRDRASAAN